MWNIFSLVRTQRIVCIGASNRKAETRVAAHGAHRTLDTDAVGRSQAYACLWIREKEDSSLETNVFILGLTMLDNAPIPITNHFDILEIDKVVYIFIYTYIYINP